jgi:PAS domain-containing protein
MGALFMAVQGLFIHGSGGSGDSARMINRFLKYGLVALVFGAGGAWYRWSQRSPQGRILIDVTRDALTASKRPGEVYPFNDAKLGVWGISGGQTMGAALHLHCGQRRFILGGRDYRIPPGTRPEAPDAGYGQPVDIDAWVTDTEFGEILTISGRQSTPSGLDARPLAAAAPTRCLLFPSPMLIQQMGPFAMRKRQQLLGSLNQPRLAIDVGADGIWVVDPNSNTLVASAPVAQVTATPETYQYGRGWSASGWEGMMARSLSTTPVLVLGIPGAQPLTIGCRDTIGGLELRFSWPGDVRQRVNDPPDFSCSGGDFLLLVEKFGLAPYLQRHDR